METKRIVLSLAVLAAVLGACNKHKHQATSSGGRRPGPMRIFVTKTESATSGNLGGLSGADARCGAAATNAGLGGDWKAWLSDSNTDAIDRIADKGPWYLGLSTTTLVFANKAQIAASGPSVVIDRAEDDSQIVPGDDNSYLYTGTDANGRKLSGGSDFCANWTSSDSAKDFIEGRTTLATTAWTNAGLAFGGVNGGCSLPDALYCIEQ